MFANHLTQEIVAAVRERVEKNPSLMLGNLARELGIPEGAAVQALPNEMRQAAPASDFAAIWDEMAGWEKVTFIAQNAGIILEYGGRLPRGAFGHGMFNLHEPDHPLGGHILFERIGAVFLVSKPFFKLESHSVQFFTAQGEQAFGVYVGRDEKRQLLPAVRQAFMALRSRYAGEGQAA